MTRPLEDTGESTPDRARQKWRELVVDPGVRYVALRDDGRSWVVRWVGEEPEQVWRRVDREWAERVK